MQIVESPATAQQQKQKPTTRTTPIWLTLLQRPQLVLFENWVILQTGIYYYGRIQKFLRPYLWMWISGLVLGMLAGAWTPVLLIAIKKGAEWLQTSGHQLTLVDYILVGSFIPLYFFIRGLLGFGNSYIVSALGFYLMRDFRLAIFKKFHEMPLSFIQEAKPGFMNQLVMLRPRVVQQRTLQVINDLIRQPIAVLSIAGTLFYINRDLAVTALLFVPIGIAPILIFSSLLRSAGKAEERQEHASLAIMQENISGTREVKSFGREDYEMQRFREASELETRRRLRIKRIIEAVSPTVEVMASLGFAAALVYGLYYKIPFDTLVAFAAGLYLIYPPLKQLSRLFLMLQRSSLALQGIFQFLDTEDKTTANAPNAIVPPHRRAKGIIELQHVSLDYQLIPRTLLREATPAHLQRLHTKLQQWKQQLNLAQTLDDEEQDLDQWVQEDENTQPQKTIPPPAAIVDFSFRFEPGRFYALVGESGAGKSSVFSLILRFYDPTSGQVFIDGYDVKTIDKRWLREQIAVVSQDVFLFHDTVYQNILYGRPDASKEEVLQAAQRAHAHEFICRLKKGYDTVVGLKGAKLSGGQAQRISLARAFLKDAPILLLDEATSALDPVSTSLVQQAVWEYSRSRTVIAIAHRLATVQHADCILVLQQGRLLAHGKHEKLLQSCSHYQELCQVQLG